MTEQTFCKKCGLNKILSEFHNDKKRKNGRYPVCKNCHNEYVRNRYKNSEVKEKRIRYYNRIKNTEEYKNEAKKRSKKFYESLVGRAKTLLNNARKSPSGKISGCSITLEHLIKEIEKGFCPMTGFPFQMDDNYQKTTFRKKNPFSPSIDRIDSKKSYTDENTRVVCWWYNMSKGELTDQETINLFKAVINNVESQ